MNDKAAHPLKVFLCHASGDKPPVRELYKRLTVEGVDAWLDQEKLLPGQNWRVEIPRAVREADVVVICLSRKSITKEGYVQKEIKFALDIAEEKPEGAIFLIPARLEECVVPERLSLWQWVDLYEENGFGKLLRSLKLRAGAVGATIEPASYVDSDKELDQRIKQLYTEGLAAFYTEDWDKACQRFRSILSEKPNHKNANEKLTEAELQRNLSKLYEQATGAVRSEDWESAIKTLEELSRRSANYKDVTQLLRNAEKQKQLKELYTEAETLHAGQKWQAVVRVFEQISAIQSDYPDPNGLLASAQKEVVELKRINELNDLYSDAISEMDAGRWHEAQTLLEKVHKSQTGFLETERLLRKVEDEIKKTEDQNRRTEQVNVLYEQAHGLVRSKNWRKALDKIEEIQQLDSQFEDKDGITEQAKSELAREEQEAQRQNELAAMYAESVRLMQEGKYQEALDKWDEVRAIDPKYPDRQWVQRTARKKLSEMTKPSTGRPAISKANWIRLGIVGLVIIAGIIVLSFTRQGVYDDFDNPIYRDSYNNLVWTRDTTSSRNTASQTKGGVMTLLNYGDNYIDLFSRKYTDKTLTSPTYIKSYFMLQPQQTGNVGIVMRISKTGAFVICYITGDGEGQSLICEAINFLEYKEITSMPIEPGSWHTAYIGVDPGVPEFTFYVDGKDLGNYTPQQPDRYKSAQYNFFITSFCSGSECADVSSSKIVEGVFDYVEIGKP